MKTKCDYCNEEVEVGLLNHIIHASTCTNTKNTYKACLLYTSDAADE